MGGLQISNVISRGQSSSSPSNLPMDNAKSVVLRLLIDTLKVRLYWFRSKLINWWAHYLWSRNPGISVRLDDVDLNPKRCIWLTCCQYITTWLNHLHLSVCNVLVAVSRSIWVCRPVFVCIRFGLFFRMCVFLNASSAPSLFRLCLSVRLCLSLPHVPAADFASFFTSAYSTSYWPINTAICLSVCLRQSVSFSLALERSSSNWRCLSRAIYVTPEAGWWSSCHAWPFDLANDSRGPCRDRARLEFNGWKEEWPFWNHQPRPLQSKPGVNRNCIRRYINRGLGLNGS